MYRYGALDRGQVRWAHLRGVQCKTLKGKKVSVPGKKGKHTIAQDVKCVVGAMGIKIIDGESECIWLAICSHCTARLTRCGSAF